MPESGVGVEVGDGLVDGGGQFVGGGHDLTNEGRHGVVGVVGHCQRGGGAGEGVAHDFVVAPGAQQDPDGGGVPVVVGVRRTYTTSCSAVRSTWNWSSWPVAARVG